MHIAMYAPALPSTGSANGIVTYARIMQAALREAGHRVTVFDRFGIEYDDGRVEPVGPDTRLPARLRRAKERVFGRPPTEWPVTFRHIIEKIHAAHPIDVLEIEESFGFAGRIGLGIPVVARLHGPHIYGKDACEPPEIARISAARIAVERGSIADTAGVTCPSPKMMAATLDHYGVSPVHAAPIYNPIPVASPADTWSSAHCNPDQLLFVGRFDLRKGADIMLRAFDLALQRRPTLRLTMCGPDVGIVGDDGEARCFDDYSKLHLRSETQKRIAYLGAVKPDRIRDLRLQSTLSVSTSRFEVLAYSLTEGLAAGMPILASDTFGIAEIVENRRNGFIAPVGDAAAVADAIVEALSDRARLAQVGAAGRDLCAGLLAPARIAAQTVDFYRAVIG